MKGVSNVLEIIVTIVIFILAASVLIMDVIQTKYISELEDTNINLTIENDTLKFDVSRYKRVIKEIEKIAFMNNYNNKEFQLRTIKEILAKNKY